jgi:TldD protein
MTDLATAALKALTKAGADFGDVRLENRASFFVRISNDQIQNLDQERRRGWGVRAFVDGAWGYSSGTSFQSSAIREAAAKATAIAKANAARGVPKSSLRRPPSGRKAVRPKIKIDPRDVASEEKVRAAMDVCAGQRLDGVRSRTSVYGDADLSFELGNTWGAHVEWREVRTRLIGQAVASEGDRQESAFKLRDGTSGWELVSGVDCGAFGREVGQEATEMVGAIKPPSGLQTVVADPGVSGLLAHEVMGHASEADEVVKRRSFLTTVVGKRVGSPLVTMFDDGTVAGAHGSIPFDGEGTPAHRTAVIDRGVYRGFLQSLETAASLKSAPTGNGRAQDFGRRVWVRMTNTFFAPGKDLKDDIISDTKSGVLTRSWVSGMEDVVGGGFQALTMSGFLIKGGEVGPRVRGMTLTGQALSILKSVDRVSKEFALDGGTCGKGEEDYVPVAAGGPYMRCKIIVGGG